MEETTNLRINEILMRLAKLQAEVNYLKEKDRKESKKEKKLTVIEESLAEVWDNEEDDAWNNV
jgi:hypothetical protein